MRLDRIDSYLTRFEAVVTAVRPGSGSTWLMLDRSAFYPTAGGQPHDTGSIGGARVIDVRDEQGIWHEVQTDDVTAGDVVVGEVDWTRRYEHMQRHSAQHMLSQAFVRVGKRYERGTGAVADRFATRSVSMRGPVCTLDLAGEVDEEDMAAAAAEVDAAARSALPVMTFEVPESRLSAFALRRPAKVKGTVRLVAIGNYDLVACGGTHVRCSAEVLPVRLLGVERVKGGLSRVSFMAGAEAVTASSAEHDVSSALTGLLSAPPADHVERATALLGRISELESALALSGARLADAVAQDLLGAAERLGDATGSGTRVVSAVLPPEDVPLLPALVDRMQSEAGVVTLLAVRAGEGARLSFLAGPGCDVDVRQALQAALAVMGGRGGGRPDRAQGSGEVGSRLEEAMDSALAALRTGRT